MGTKKLSQPLPLGLAMIAGLGLTLMVIALGIGVTQAGDSDTGLVSGMFVLGVILFFFGTISWAAVIRPWERFDDINVPMYTGHHDHDNHEEHAVIVVDTPDIEPHGESHS